jgi:DNA end-binding protein Ku
MIRAMAARAIGSGTISFGLVSIPVKLFSTTRASAGVSFNLLHDKCGSRLKQRYFCPVCDEQVERDGMVKGYEFAKDQYVRFTEEEIKSMAEEATNSIEITEFVPVEKVDPVYFDTPWFLGPDKGGDRAYALLSEAMTKTGRTALAKYAARGKQYLVMLRPAEGGLVMQQLRYADEVRTMEEVELAPVEVKEPELRLAIQFIEQLATSEFRPEQYEDEVKLRMQQAIQRKVEGEEVTAAPAEAPKAQIIDLMEALKASLQQTGAAPAAPKPKRAEATEHKATKRTAAKKKSAKS